MNRKRRRITPRAAAGGCLLACASFLAAADEPAAPIGEVRDTIMMMDTGPLHVRLHVLVGGKSPKEARQETIERVIKALDTDGNGVLSREESQRSPLFREKQRPGAEKFLKSIGAQRSMSRDDIEKKITQFETVVYRQNTNESDTDGQVFELLDADRDEVVSETEMLNAVDLILAKDVDDDECVTLDEMQPPPDPNAMSTITVTGAPARPVSSVADIIRDTSQTLLVADLLRKYDADRNRKLSSAELAWPAERLKPCDANGDGELDERELHRIDQTTPDIELVIDVVRMEGSMMLRVLSGGGQDSEESYPDVATVKLPAAVVTFSTRDVDPFEASMTIAMRTFNELDLDANGYLDRDETMDRERFGRGLFDQIDADGDAKIFGEEMKAFILARGEPIATTCHVTAYDDGAGFFSTLDANGDRRISMREMRYADKYLARAERDKKPGIGKLEPPRRYRVEFVRGVYDPFGSSERQRDQATPAVTARPRPVGPIWFQRWDRNNDGDLTWREFIGPRDVFEQLDVDRDGLLDPKEAEKAADLADSAAESTASTVHRNPQTSLPE